RAFFYSSSRTAGTSPGETSGCRCAETGSPRFAPVPCRAYWLKAGIFFHCFKRELYFDAFTWITANDFSWPYSFVNVCKLLDVSPEVVRTEIFADASLSLFV